MLPQDYEDIGGASEYNKEEASRAAETVTRLASAMSNTLFSPRTTERQRTAELATSHETPHDQGMEESKTSDPDYDDDVESPQILEVVNEDFHRDVMQHLLQDVFGYGNLQSSHGLVKAVVKESIYDMVLFLQVTDEDWRVQGERMN